ncbi:protease complex subunit PrcB family protein [Clostridium sp. AN503]|uniref:protease complex subunit PrcB family protein n=1 Tax=Clostridium sp. AN503 TaxID=3160598 RepID=UPI00345956E8
MGYGEQPTGGYSISVNELYLTENSIVIDTELKGPEKGEEVGVEKSYPYIVVQTEYLENPVIFQ